jgi:hypothetical protein
MLEDALKFERCRVKESQLRAVACSQDARAIVGRKTARNDPPGFHNYGAPKVSRGGGPQFQGAI